MASYPSSVWESIVDGVVDIRSHMSRTLASGTLSFTTGQQVKTIPITIRRGTQTDPVEFFTVQLSLPSNSGSVSLSVPIGVITIVQPSRIYIPVVIK